MRNKVPRKTTTVQNVLEATESEKGGNRREGQKGKGSKRKKMRWKKEKRRQKRR